MSAKKLLGLEACPLSESEIMQKIIEAQKKDLRVIVFPSAGKNVQIRLQRVNPQGIMRQYQNPEDLT
jgi:hypothetical protein